MIIIVVIFQDMPLYQSLQEADGAYRHSVKEENATYLEAL